MSEPPARNVTVIGGGIAGIAAALRLRTLDPDIAITILEAATRIGGKIAGEVVDGCVVDGGADVCIGDKLRATHLFSELGLGPRVIRVNPDALATYELRDGHLRRSSSTFSGELVTFRTGIHEIVSIARDAISNVVVRTAVSATAIESIGSRWSVTNSDGTSLVADAVIIATPAATSATLLSTIAPDQAAELTRLSYPSTTTVTMAWDARDVPHPLDGTGYLVADPASAMTACTWTSSKIPSHAPGGVRLLRGYIRTAMTRVEPAALMRTEVATVLGITASPLFTRRYDWDAGLPVFTESHRACVRNLERLLGGSGLTLAGSAFHGVGIPDCIDSGERAAAGIMAYLAITPKEEAA